MTDPDNKVVERIMDRLYEAPVECESCESEAEHEDLIRASREYFEDRAYEEYRDRELGV